MQNKTNLLCGLLLTLTITTLAQVVQNPTQPIGTLVRTYEVTGALPFPIQPPIPPSPMPVPPVTPFPPPTTPLEEVNYICAQWDNEETTETPPFDVRYPVTEIILTVPQHFVRLLGTPKSGSNGAWIMRSEYVRGKTPAELRDIFALPAPPIAIVDVEMPASPNPATGKDYVLWTGIAGPIRGPGHDWGDGGSVQNRLVADYGTAYFPNYGYTNANTRIHRQPLGAYALSYRPMAGLGNTYNIASYLDTYIPVAYSDLENVYTDLDYLNFVDFGPCPLRNALHQISPERYDALAYLDFRNALLFGESILEVQLYRQWQNRWFPCESSCACDRATPNVWLQSVNEWTTNVPVGCGDNFKYTTNGLIACADWQVRPDITIGISATGLGNSLKWCACSGKAKSGTIKGGLYANYFRRQFFINGLLCGGGTWSSAHRSIEFYNVNRNACSHQTAGDFQAHLQTGLTVKQGIVPYARLSYVLNRQGAFNECGADSLNLNVQAYTTHTLHTNIGVELNHLFQKARVSIMPLVQLAWADDFFLRSRVIKAQLCGPQGCLCVHGMDEMGSYFVGSVGLNVIFNNCFTLLARYEAQVRTNCVIQDAKLGLQMSF